MPVEIELKLSLLPEHLNTLKRHPLLKIPAGSRVITQKLYNIYYDTPNLDLCHNTMELRLRRIGKRWLQTLKVGGGVQAGLYQRNEWEVPVSGENLDFDALKVMGCQLTEDMCNQLKPVFITEYSRNVRLLKFEGTEFELCLNSGAIRAGKRSRPISEIELELKSGDPHQLFSFALALLDRVPLEVEHANKAEYGYQLLSGESPTVCKASCPSMNCTQDIGSAIQSMISSCLQHIQANVSGAILSDDEEFLHQVRLGLRRLRVVLKTAKAFREDDELYALCEEAAEMYIEFGRLRDWDVLVTQTFMPMLSRPPEVVGLRELIDASEKRRRRYHVSMVRQLRSPNYQRFLLRFGAWMYGSYWHETTAEASMVLPAFAVQNLEKLNTQVLQRGKLIATADASQLHRLRIACKKLRYSAESFGSLFNANKFAAYVTALSELQDILGKLNDFAVANRLLTEMEDNNRHITLELVRGLMQQEHADNMARLAKTWRSLVSRKAFWQ